MASGASVARRRELMQGVERLLEFHAVGRGGRRQRCGGRNGFRACCKKAKKDCVKYCGSHDNCDPRRNAPLPNLSLISSTVWPSFSRLLESSKNKANCCGSSPSR